MNRTRLLLFSATILIIASSIFSYVFFENVFLLRKWSIPIDPPGFFDARQITMASESYAQGYDPLKENPLNPRGTRLNYPRIWHILFATGITQNHTNLLGIIFLFLFFIGVGMFWFSGKFNNLTYFILSAVTISPAVMLGIERGNIELVIFFILSAALLINYYSSVSAIILFLFASFLKLYPVFAFVYLLKEQSKKFWVQFISACAIFIIYALFTFDDLKQVYLTSPKNAKSAYGLNVFWMGLNHPRILNLQVSDDLVTIIKVLSYVVLILIFLGALILSLRNYNTTRFKQREHLEAFRTGAGIYIGCFLLGTNYDYRLVFLIFTVPQLAAWLGTEKKEILTVPFITLSAIVFSCWSYLPARFLGMKLTFVLKELSNWTVLSGLLYLFFASMPGWLRNYLNKPFSLIGVPMNRS